MDSRLLFPFRKVEDQLIFVEEWSWCSVRILDMDDSLRDRTDTAIIDALIKSPFHLWRGEQCPGGMDWIWNGQPVHIEQFGPWDRTLMSAADYSPVSHAATQELLRAHHVEHIEADEQVLRLVADAFISYVPVGYHLFHLSLGKEDLKTRQAVNSLFSHFKAFIGIDRKEHRTLIFEAGMD